MNKFYNIPKEAKSRIYSEVGERINLPAYAIEKDWWVVQTLSILFEMKIGKHLVFKGGTSLSKAWNIIERFSEDIDLAVDRTFFGFEGDLGKNQRTKLRKTANTYITDTLYSELNNAFIAIGLTNLNIELEEIVSTDQDPIIISIYYPNVTHTPGYIQPRIQVEISCRSLREPFEKREVLSLVDETYPESEFSQQAVQIPSVLPERTFLEKVFLLHEEFQRPKEKIRVDRLSRHLYDIYQISKKNYAAKAIENKNLYETIVKHRHSFTRLGGVDYNLHQPQTINFIPPKEMLSAWEADYKTMQEQMIHGDSPNFTDLMQSLTTLKNAINSSSWKINANF